MVDRVSPPVLERRVLEELIFRIAPLRRFTQDSPVLPDVWFEYGRDPSRRVDLLLTPFRTASPGAVYREVRARLDENIGPSDYASLHNTDEHQDLAYSQSTVVVKAWFDELVRVLLPVSAWQADRGDTAAQWIALPEVADPRSLADQLVEMERGRTLLRNADLLWMIRIVGTIEMARRGDVPDELTAVGPDRPPLSAEHAEALVSTVIELLSGTPPLTAEGRSLIFTISLNRLARTTVWRSVQAVKADAARRLFELACEDLQWAVVDSGIDAEHPAFRIRRRDGSRATDPFEGPDGRPANNTRIVGTYDFTRIRELLTPEKLRGRQIDRRVEEALLSIGETVQDLATHLQSGRRIDWDVFAPLLEVPMTQESYTPPTHEHGTHVAGILAGDWRIGDDDAGNIDHDLMGVCPDLRLYDIRVLDDYGTGDEFSIIAALQFIRHLNANKDHVVLHGVNLSLSIPHDVANYACGRTPICEECERLTGNGVIVVAAAGNEGYIQYLSAAGGFTEGYQNISITDPGNADGVITVGATHRYRPHTYGVSYFSSRGPTGDGRSKPDLVAPGEKIWSAVPGGNVRTLDGTSMATPHVSGTAALLIARHRELVGQPERVKEILARTATDLGRERYFQGAGMVDVLRAIQSV
jgi:hypothetical protein